MLMIPTPRQLKGNPPPKPLVFKLLILSSDVKCFLELSNGPPVVSSTVWRRSQRSHSARASRRIVPPPLPQRFPRQVRGRLSPFLISSLSKFYSLKGAIKSQSQSNCILNENMQNEDVFVCVLHCLCILLFNIFFYLLVLPLFSFSANSVLWMPPVHSVRCDCSFLSRILVS